MQPENISQFYKRTPSKSIQSQLNAVHIFTPYFFKTHFNTIHLRLGLQSGLFPSGFPAKIL
jgi:hypothetical protein